MKKIYNSPEWELILIDRLDVLTASDSTYSAVDSGNGEWLDWQYIFS